MIDLHAIPAFCLRSSGLKGIAIIHPQDLLVTPKWYHLPYIQELQFKPGKAAYNITHRMFNGLLIYNSSDTDSGDTYGYSVELDIQAFRLEVDYLVAKLRNRKVHVLCTLTDDSQVLVPNCRLSTSGSPGAISNPQGHKLRFATELDRPAPWINEPVSLIGGPYIPPATGGGSGAEFEPVTITTSAGSYIYQVPAGKLLLAIFVRSTSAQTISIGYSAGASELAGPMELEANIKYQFGDNWLLTDTNTNIYFSGLAGTNTIQICVL